ncbi:MAG: hypothetical protein AAF790_15815, partial [Planctomycetota bacterium]
MPLRGGAFSLPDTDNADTGSGDAATVNTAPADAASPGDQAAGDLILSKPAAAEAKPAAAKEQRRGARSPRPSAGADAAAPAIEPAIDIDESVSPQQFWDAYFTTGAPDPVAVRDASRRLMKAKRFDHVQALVYSALRNGQPQPWMYEALGIALQLSGSSPAEVERAIMSAADFSTTPDELMLVAHYLLNLERDRRAIQVYQQVAKVDPNRTEVYLLTLRAAERADDLDGIAWATEAILGRAWPSEQAEVERVALRLAKATIRRLEAEGDYDTLADYRRRLQQAMVRDCVVRVSWTGPADLDLIVEEPSGAVCSQAQPRTAGGGINLGDTYAVEHEPGIGGFSETYICPRAFAGDYRVRVERVWGDVTAGKVTVDVVTNFRSPQAVHRRQQIDLGKDGAVVLFNVAEGRRQEPIAQEQLARALQRQEDIGRAVLAQQLSSMSDPGATPVRPEDRLRQLTRPRRGGAVGFQPQVQQFQDGTSMQVNAVASADRRYVIIRPAPLFSTIG